MPRSGSEKVARGETSGTRRISFPALKTRAEDCGAPSERDHYYGLIPDVARLATFFLRPWRNHELQNKLLASTHTSFVLSKNSRL
jgi:hypothetical protein